MKRISALPAPHRILPLAFALALSACSKNTVAPSITGDQPSLPRVSASAPMTASALKDSLISHCSAGKCYVEVEATLADNAFNKISAYSNSAKLSHDDVMSQELDKVMNELNQGAQAIELRRIAKVGYEKFMIPYQEDLLASVKKLTLTHEMLINPVIATQKISDIKALSADMDATLKPKGVTSNASTDAFSGLVRIHAPEFVAQAQKDIGDGTTVVNGSSVKIGITDTGITYNHPTFLSADGKKVRISYMKDFSREGRMYFNPQAKFVATPSTPGSTSAVDITAELIVTKKLPDFPAGDVLKTVKLSAIKVSKELFAILTAPNTQAKLGFIDEAVFTGAEDQVDLAHDGSLKDVFLAVFVPANPSVTGSADKVYVDFSGNGDLSQVTGLRDWNATQDMTTVYAEKIGFDIRKDDFLPDEAGKNKVTVYSASIVGFDPGNHGSHVSGIAAGSKTLQNDSAMTLARGVAPEATLMMDRVCANNGGCDATEAMIDIAMAGAQVINMSLGGLSPFNDGYGVEETIVNRISQLTNTLYVIAAGNSGPARQTIGSPSVARLSLSVGASASVGMIQRQYEWPALGSPVDADSDYDFMLFFSSRGPTASGGFKPNLSAPGTELSSVQLNAAPGANAGLDVYWGTSMATPTATGAYALFLDAIQKYNLKNPAKKLTTNSMELRQVLIESARPFQMKSFDLTTGIKTDGIYTWADEGTGEVDLLAAWKKLFALRDSGLASSVQDAGANVPLDYKVIVSQKEPNGLTYDGSRTDDQSLPEFGQGIYLDYKGMSILKQVFIQRNLPADKAAAPNAGDLDRQLESTADEFVLKTVIYGSDKAWIKAGTFDELNCASPQNNLMLIGHGATIGADPKTGAPTTSPTIKQNILNVCIDRGMIADQLAPGDHGALISGYRVVNGVVSPVASFTVPVYVMIPQTVMKGSTAYEVNSSVNSFDVARNYVEIPQGTSVVQITLEVPPLKIGADGQLAPGEECSGVELMALQGDNSTGVFATRPEARVMNCNSATGVPLSDDKRVIHFSKINPTPGIWDMHVFGSYYFNHSKYKLRVDYVTATADKTSVTGNLSALNGSFNWTVKSASLAPALSPTLSQFELDSLYKKTTSLMQPDGFVDVPGADGKIAHSYTADVKSVTIGTGNCPGNDIDLYVYECDPSAKDTTDASCTDDPSMNSTGPTDVESVNFTPKPGKVYFTHVLASTVPKAANFDLTEAITYATEVGTISITGSAPNFNIAYSFPIANSKLLTQPAFMSGSQAVTGTLTLKANDGSTMYSLPVDISAK